MFLVGALQEVGVNPPVLRHGNAAFPISTKVPRMFVLLVFLDGPPRR